MAGKTRSPRFAGASLPDAIKQLASIDRSVADRRVSAHEAASILGYHSLSGPAKVALGALHQYGLLNRSGGDVQISHLGRQLLSATNQEEWAAAFRRSALMPPFIRELLEFGRELTDEELRDFLQSRRFVEEGIRRFTRAFRATEAALVNLSRPPGVPSNLVADRSSQALSFQIPFTAGTLFVDIRYSNGPVRPVHIELVRHQLDIVERSLKSE